MKSKSRSEVVDQREAWYRLATRCAAQIRKQCGTPEKETEQRILGVFRSALQPRGQAGRKPDHETVRGAELWPGGMLRYAANPKQHPSLKRYQRGLWQRIYHEALSAFAHLEKLTRQYRAWGPACEKCSTCDTIGRFRPRLPNMSNTISYPLIVDALRGTASAFRRRSILFPAGGDGQKIFPPTYLDGPYIEEQRVIGNEKVETVLLDSVQSQANRMELALLRAVRNGRIEMPVWQVDFRGTEVSDVGILSALETPHRIADAIFRDSLLDGKDFASSAWGQQIEASSNHNATALLESCPTALLFGIWHSTGKRGGMGAKFARAIVSEIFGVAAEIGKHAAGRIDPLNISSKADVYMKEKDTHGWRSDAAKDFKKKSPAEINHGNIPPAVPKPKEGKSGGVTIREAVQTTVLSLPALRRLSFPLEGGSGDSMPVQALLVAMGLLASELLFADGFDLRSRCLLDGEPGPWELLNQGRATHLAVTADLLIKAYQEAVDAVRAAKYKWSNAPVVLKPQPKLVKLVQQSRQIQAQGEQE